MDTLRTPSPATTRRGSKTNLNPTVNETLKPDIKPIKPKEYDIPKSKYPQCGSLPLRMIISVPSGSGKGIVIP